MKNIKRRVLIKICVVTLLLVLIIIFCFSPLFKVNKLVITNSTELVDEDINKELDLLGKHIVPLSVSSIEEDIKGFSIVKSVSVEKKMPNQLIIDIEEREPLFIFDYFGVYLVLDEEMIVIKAIEDKIDYPVISGFEFDSFKIGEKIKTQRNDILTNVISLIKLLNKLDQPSVDKIYYENNSIVVDINDEMHVRFGKGNNIEEKFNAFLDVYYNLASKNIKSGTVDVSIDGLPVFRPFE